MTQLDFLDGRKSVRTFDPTAQISNQGNYGYSSHAANALQEIISNLGKSSLSKIRKNKKS